MARAGRRDDEDERPALYGLAAPRATTFIAVGEGGTVLRSDDGGRSWRAVRLPTRADLRAVAFRGDLGYIVGTAGALFATRDGGDTWRRVRLATDWDLEAVCLATDRVHYLAGESGRLFKTHDGGRTWEPLGPPAAKRLTGLAFRDDRLGYAVGTDGIILETVDGGSAWRRLGSRSTARSRRSSSPASGSAMCAGRMAPSPGRPRPGGRTSASCRAGPLST